MIVTEALSPDLFGTSLEEAKLRLSDLGLYASDIWYVESAHPDWTVVDQEPPSGRVMATGSGVRLSVSRSSLSQYLPGIYQVAETSHAASPLVALLRVTQHIFDEIEAVIDGAHRLFDPEYAPCTALRWLAGWIAFALDDSWTDEKARRLLGQAARLHRLRGTAVGIKHLLAAVFSLDVRVYERAWPSGMRIGVRSTIEHDSYIEVGRAIDEDRDYPHSFVVEWTPRSPGEASPDFLRRVGTFVDAIRPAHTRCFVSATRREEALQARLRPMQIEVRSTIESDFYIGGELDEV